jgi:hypothetical protein
MINNRTWTIIGSALLVSSIGCKTTSMPKLPRLGWLGPRDAETVVAAETKSATELPPPSSAAVPNSPVKQAAAAQPSIQPNAMASAAVNTEPLKTYPATPYPNFQVAQTNSSASQNYPSGVRGAVATPPSAPGGYVPTVEATTAQPQAQQGFYDTNYDASTPRSPQPPADAFVPNYSMPSPEASTGLSPSTPQNSVTANPYVGQQAAGGNMPATYATPQQGYSPQNQYAAPISATAPTGSSPAPATYVAEAQAAPAQTDAGPSSPSYYSQAQQQVNGPWRPGSTACQNGTCFASPGSETGGTNAAPRAGPQVAQPYQTQPYQTQTSTNAMATQPQGSQSRDSTWR